jgi:radical SAM superfamily enzyme YgiQ (UPF0313 family)
MAMRPMDTLLKTRMSPSLALLTIANMFHKEHTVIIENENIEDINFDEVVDIVGITITVDVFDRAIEIAEKFQCKGIPVVAGGIHVTAFPEETKKYFDVLAVGLAEKTWPDIIRDFQDGKLKKVYWCNHQISGSEIISPGYRLIDSRKYLYCNIISTSRGCPFHCDFCYNSCEAYKTLYINRPIEDVIKDIKTIGKRHVMFIDDNFIGNPQWTLEFVKAIRPMRLKWNAAVSTNIVNMLDLLDEMALSGCESLFIGFESLNENAIKNVHKHQNNILKYELLVEEIHKRGIMINASFVFGLDDDDVSTFKTTLDWIVKNKIETITSHILTPYPGTKVYDQFIKDGRITDFDFSKYNTANVVIKPKNMTDEELYNGYIWIYEQIYSTKNIFKRMPNAHKQRIPYLLFNFLYRKYGKATEKLCELITYERVGKIAEKLSYRL